MSIRGLSKVPRKDLKALQEEIASIGQTFQRRRRDVGLTQEELAELLDVNVNSVKYIEQGRRIPSLLMILRISKVLKLKFNFSEK